MYIGELRMKGFKSFADATSLPLSGGLTVVVGPNGAGKSNIVDGLRWMSGESSAKKVRGSELEDLIFSGTRDRMPLLRMEVELSIEGVESQHLSKVFGDHSLQTETQKVVLVRRLEKGKGSSYNLNGKDVLKRDVDIFLGDIAFGREALSIVGQGVVADIVGMGGAKRRQILEATAGLQGLKERYQDAGSRLRGVAQNLEKLQEYEVVFSDQIQTLEDQVKKVRRYRNYGREIRSLILFRLRKGIENIDQKLSESEISISESQAKEVALATQIAQQERAIEAFRLQLPHLRAVKDEKFADEQEARFALRTLELKIQQAEEEKSLRDRERQAILSDMEREEKELHHAGIELEKLTKQLSEQKVRQTNADKLAHKHTDIQKLQENLQHTGKSYEQAYQELIHLKSQKEKAVEMAAFSRNRMQEYARQQEQAKQALSAIEHKLATSCDLSEEEQEAAYHAEHISLQEQKIEELRETREQQKEILDQLHADLEKERTLQQQGLQTVRDKRIQVEAEKNTLRQMWDDEVQSVHAIVKDVAVEAGYEHALSAVWEQKILSGRFKSGDHRDGWREDWHKDHHRVECIAGTQPLLAFVDIPEFLHGSLSGVGVVETREEGFRRQHEIPRGAALVARDGSIWRWDGYVRHTSLDAPRTKNNALALKKRSEALSLTYDALVQEEQTILRRIEATTQHFQEQIDSTQHTLQAIERDIKEASQQKEEREETLAELRAALRQTEQLQERLSWEKQQQQDLHTQATTQALREKEAYQKHEMLLKSMPNFEKQQEQVEELRKQRKEYTDAVDKKNQEIRALEKEQAQVQEQISLLSRDVEEWKRRQHNAEQRLASLTSRKKDFFETYQEISPAKRQEWEKEREGLISQIDEKVGLCNAAEQEVLKVEEQERQKQNLLRESQGQHLEIKEEVSAKNVQKEVLIQERKKLDEEKQKKEEEQRALHTGNLAEEQEQKWLRTWEAKSYEALQSEQKRLEDARERMGGVNLLAEQELSAKKKEQEARLLQIQDIKEAADMLTRSKQDLEKEAVKRFQQTFAQINAYFSENFYTVFGGGFASLVLKDPQDILNSDVEIEVQMPGKRVKHLSLLSGGEQSMVALCLIFGMFRTYPAPLYVLDEVDAALDDVNVGKLCALIEQYVQEQSMRFLIVSHHRLTMASADRLFGVTMVEKGVSKIVSVDLVEALKNADKN